ncbi:short-chain dehydrogenase [Paraphaeosphaeria sporulosa]|uniref:Short-chain dehydrogenase n=1 Tax=Paraphaeosphaeria sporulosa TaxID=1460663 RepID=A0A177CT58_9PLEO|nr:short-chain dehydrogenase [Paraphaeosphaeria sporulosa]OAG10476.1 short-chain dehydrogenase [Paraphaeosphaeria sporulosa]
MTPYNLPADAVWFVTGCSSGIGYALCEYLIKHTSSRVVATARKPTTLACLPDGPNILKLALDVTSDASIQTALNSTLSRFARIDVVVNNAGYGVMGDTESMDLPRARGVMDTNFWGAVRVTQLSLPILREENIKTGRRGGLVMQITSMGGRVAFAGTTFYHASKFALEGFTEGLSKELPTEWDIHFLCVEPGGVKSKYAETGMSTFDEANRLEVYKDPNMPTNQLLKYIESPGAAKNWAEPERVAEVLYGYVKKGGEMPLRLPLGSDAWGLLKAAAESNAKELEVLMGVSCSTSGKEQLESLDFLK